MPNGAGHLRIAASLGVAASAAGDKTELIAAADGALLTATRKGRADAVAE